MQHVSNNAFRSVSAADRKTAALAAFDAASMAPHGADWRAVAYMLHAALPVSRAKSEAPGGIPAWFADYALPRSYQQQSMHVAFADGVSVRCNIHTVKGKAPRIAAACRIAVAFYRARTGRDMVPAFASLRVIGTGAEFDAAECTRLTVDVRARAVKAEPWIPVSGPLCTPRTGESRVQRMERVFGGTWYADKSNRVMRAHAAPGIRWTEEVEQYGDDAEYEAGMAGERRAAVRAAWAAAWSAQLAAEMRADLQDARLALWTEAVADDYAEPAPFEYAVTPVEGIASVPPVEAIATGVPSFGDTPADAMPICPAVGEPCKADCPHRSGCGRPIAVEAPVSIFAPAIVVEKIDMPEATTFIFAASNEEAKMNMVEPDAWAPSAETHPVIALALSHKAREALFDRVQDGTFPAAGKAAKAGAWRLTLADALALQDLGSVRFVGMPRKAYTRRGEAA